ncbi:Short-chain dehydrogenase virD [Linum perenne]
MVQSVVPHMASRRKGTIVNVGSVVGKAPTPWAGSYCASKAYVHAMSHSLRVELKPFGINVVLVIPGSIKSNLGKANMEKLQGIDHDWKIYKDFKEAIAERARASQGPKATDASILAKEVANRVLRSTSKPPKLITFGHMTGLFAMLSVSPLWVRDLFFSKRFGLNKKI